jgi:tetratricopeptide (TPR) repeat protein
MRLAHAWFWVALLFGVGFCGSATAQPPAADAAAMRTDKVSVQPLDLAAVPRDEDLIAAGQLGGPLYPVEQSAEPAAGGSTGPLSAVARFFESESAREQRRADRRAAQNLSFGEAIQCWNAHDWDAATELFDQHLAEYPDSPWAPEAEIHLACEARYQGRYTEAEHRYQSILDRLKDADDFRVRSNPDMS